MTSIDLHALAIEHAMRITSDEALVQAIALASTPQSRLVALGQLLGQIGPVELTSNSPLYAWAKNTEVRSDWRIWCPVRDDSLFATLEWLRSLLGAPLTHDPAPSLLDELASLRILAASLTAPTAPVGAEPEDRHQPPRLA